MWLRNRMLGNGTCGFGVGCWGMELVASNSDLGKWLQESGLGLRTGCLGIGLQISWVVVSFPGSIRHLPGLGSGGSFRHLTARGVAPVDTECDYRGPPCSISERSESQHPRGLTNSGVNHCPMPMTHWNLQPSVTISSIEKHAIFTTINEYTTE